MKRMYKVLLTVVAGLAVAGSALYAQQPAPSVYPTVTEPVMMPVVHEMPVSHVFQAPAPCAAPCVVPATTKICVCEMKPATKLYYGCKCEDYCLPHCTLWGLLTHQCGCEGRDCGCVHTRNKLVLRRLPTEPNPVCVVREVPFGCDAPK